MVEVSSILTLLGIVSIGLVTPGPNNLTALIHAGLHGPRSNARLIVGMATGFILLQILVARSSIDCGSPRRSRWSCMVWA